MERPVLMLTAFWVLCIAVSIGFIVEGFAARTGTGIFLGVLGIVGLLAAIVFIGAVVNHQRHGDR